jgi:uncharacterized oxidoreductase
MQVHAQALERIARTIFEAAGSAPEEAAKVAARLIEANLCGHDSHGIIRVYQYVNQAQQGSLVPNQSAEVVSETEVVTVMDGRWGFGQIVAEQAMRAVIDKARRHGLAMVALRNASHVGRLADWAIMAAEEGQAAIILCNAVNVPPIVAPHGGRDARASTNPMAIAVPMEGGRPILLDFATSAIAEGKVRVARNKGVEVPVETLIDADGRPTRDPNDLYSEPRGALLPLGGALSGHKGGGLSLMCDLLGGAFSGGRCNWAAGPDEPHFSNNFLALVIAPGVFLDARALAEEVRNYTAFVKSSRPRAEGGEVLLPGEPEQRSKAERTRNGIPIEEATWKQLMEAGELAGLRRSELEALAA